jgi:hypothetical protein
VGFYKYDGTHWTNYYIPAAAIPTNFYFNVYAAHDNSAYFGSWGSGFLRVKEEEFTVFNSSNTGMEGVDENPEFLVIGGINSDSRNNLWVLNFGAVNNNTLSMMNPDAEWFHFPVEAENNRYFQERYNLAIDQFDTKWYCTQQGQDAGPIGLWFFNEGHTYNNFSDDRSGFLNSSSGLNDNFIYSLALDRRGELWVGTSLGVNIISNLQNAALSDDPDLRITSVFSLRQQTIKAIAVDPLNQKWIGTNQGLLLVNPDGTQLLASFDTDNSPLPSNEIISIAINNNTGTVFVGTSNGLASFETQAVEPKESFEELTIYPNPFLLNKEENSLTIDGLIRDTDIKILTISGKLILEFSTPGGRVASWDGRDANGNLVPSGIYMVVAFDVEGNNVTTGKVAVIRE